MAKKETKSSKDKRSGFKDFKAELKKVIWPTKEQLAKNTIAVVSIVLGTALLVFILDVAFESLNKYGISKLQSSYYDSHVSQDSEHNHETENEETENNEDETSDQEENSENEDTTTENNNEESTTNDSDSQNIEVEQNQETTGEQNQ